MKRHSGFTLAELMVVVAILGILGATAMPLYNTWQQRAYGSEAAVMIKRILDAEVMYFLENEDFFPGTGDVIEIYHDGTQKYNGAVDPTVIQDILDALKIPIPVGHFLDFTIRTMPGQICMVTVASFQGSALFKGGVTSITGTVDSTGNVIIQKVY